MDKIDQEYRDGDNKIQNQISNMKEKFFATKSDLEAHQFAIGEVNSKVIDLNVHVQSINKDLSQNLQNSITIRNSIKEIESALGKIRIDNKRRDLEIETNHNTFNDLQDDHALFNEKLKILTKDLEHISSVKVDKQDFTQLSNYTKKDYLTLRNRVDELEGELRKTDNYIDAKLPFVFTTISGEMLDYCFSKKSDLYKLEQFMKLKLKECSDKISQTNGWSADFKDIDDFDPETVDWKCDAKPADEEYSENNSEKSIIRSYNVSRRGSVSRRSSVSRRNSGARIGSATRRASILSIGSDIASVKDPRLLNVRKTSKMQINTDKSELKSVVEDISEDQLSDGLQEIKKRKEKHEVSREDLLDPSNASRPLDLMNSKSIKNCRSRKSRQSPRSRKYSVNSHQPSMKNSENEKLEIGIEFNKEKQESRFNVKIESLTSDIEHEEKEVLFNHEDGSDHSNDNYTPDIDFEEIVERILPILNLEELEQRFEDQILNSKSELVDLIQEELEQNQAELQHKLDVFVAEITEKYQTFINSKAADILKIQENSQKDFDVKIKQEFSQNREVIQTESSTLESLVEDKYNIMMDEITSESNKRVRNISDIQLNIEKINNGHLSLSESIGLITESVRNISEFTLKIVDILDLDLAFLQHEEENIK